jgi:valyl-tRNA synthetase
VSPWIAALRLHATLGETPGDTPTEDAWARRLLPMQLRPQAHDIIRTWAFYTIVKAYLHTGTIPWQTLAISGHALGPDGRKISKSKDHAAVNPEALITRYGADAVRYWACNGTLGNDQPVNEQALRQGGRLMTKLWNAARLIEEGRKRAAAQSAPTVASNWPLDRALLSWLQQTIRRATAEFRAYNYAAALDLIERFFWGTFCDEYLEMIKSRLYDGDAETQAVTLATMETTLLAVLQLLAPIMPHVTEAIYQELFATHPDESIHTAQWPAARDELLDPQAEAAGAALIAIAGAVRRYKSAQQRSMGSPLGCLRIAAAEPSLRDALERSAADLASVSRAQRIEFVDATSIAGGVSLGGGVTVGIEEAA